MAFPNSNLPANVQPWSREVQNRLEALERNVKANEINGISRDVQLDTNYKRIDKIVNDLVVTEGRILIAQAQADQAIIDAADAAGEAQDAALAAQSAANAAATAATTANGAATTANTSLNGLIGLNATGSGYKLNADNINGGTITGITLTGVTVNTASSPNTRVSMTGSEVQFYNSNVGSGTTKTGYIWGPGNGGMFFGTSGDSHIWLSTGSIEINTGGASPTAIFANGTSVSLEKPTSTSSTLDVGTYLTVGNNATIDERIINPGGYGAVVTNATNMFIASNGAIARTTTTSSREAKKNIQPLEFNSDDFISVSPVTFDYKDGIITEGSGDGVTGFIAEDFQDLGFDELIIPKESENDYIGLRYDKLYMFLHKVVAEQQERIKALEARLGAQ